MIYFLDNSLQLQKIVTSKNVISAIHEHELNGLIRADVELDLSYANKFLILGIDHVGYYYKDEFYLHKIQRVEYDHVNESAKVVLRHIFFEDMIFGKLIQDVRPQNQDALAVSRQTIDANTRWQTIMTDVTGRLSTNFYWQVPYEVIEFMTENYRIDYLPKILFDGKKINGFQLHLANKIGEDKNIRIPYGSRVLDLKYEEDYSEIITKLVVHGKGEEVGDGYGRRINISDVNFSRNGVESPIGSLYLEDESITNTYGNDGQTPREGREVFEDIESVNELAEAGYQHYLQVSRPQMLFTADVADIGDVGIGDSVMIIRREYDVYFNARIHKLSVDLLYPEDAQVELGDYKHFKESKIARKTREKNNRVQGQLSDRITRLKREANDRFDNEVEQWKSEYEQALIDVHAEIEADRENMTNLIEGTRTEFTDNLNAEITQTKEYAEEQAQEKANAVRTDLETVTSGHQALIDGLKDNVLDIDTFLGDKSETLKQQFDKVHTDFSTLQTDLDGVESDLTATKSDLQNQLDEARAELEGLEVGGRNYLENSKERHRNPQNSGNFNFETYYLTQELTGQVTVSGFLEFEEGASNSITISLRDSDYNNILLLTLDIDADGYFEGKADVSQIIHCIYIYMGRIGQTSGNGGYLRLVKIEKGNKATDWTPTPEDTEAKITFLNEQIEFIDGQLSAKLEQTDIEPINNKITEYGNTLTANAQSIQSLLDKTELHDGDITQWSNETKANAESISQTLTRVEETESGISQAQTDIQTNADGIAGVIRDVETIDGNLSSLTTEFNVEAGKIETLISKTDGHTTQLSNIVADYESIEQTVAANDDWLGTHGSNVLQTVDGFDQKVWLSDVAEINPNLIPFADTSNKDNVNRWESWTAGTLTSNSSGELFLSSYSTSDVIGIESSEFELVEGRTYTASVKVRSSAGWNSSKEWRYTWLMRKSGSNSFLGSPTRTTVINSTTDIHEWTFTVDRTENVGVMFGTYRLNAGEHARIAISEPKIEEGTERTLFMNAFSNIEQKANELSLKVAELTSVDGEDFLTQSDITVQADRVRIGSVSIGSTDMASILSVSPSAIDMITDELNLTGNLNVKGQIEAISLDAIDANFARVQTAILKSDVITSEHLSVSTAMVHKLFAASARIDELITKSHFVNKMHALTLDVVDLNASQIRTKLLSANTIEASWIKSGTALVDRVFSSTAMFERMMAKSGFVTTLNTVTIDTDQITIRRPDGGKLINNGVLENTFAIQFIQPRFEGVGVDLSANYYKTTNTSYTTAAAFSYLRGGRYLTVEGYCEMRGDVAGSADTTIGAIRLLEYSSGSRSAFTTIENRRTNNGNNQFFRIRLDLGVPEYEQRNFYVQFYTAHSGNGAYFRINQAYYHG